MKYGELEPRVRTLADSVPVLLWISDADGGCVFFNRRWLEFTGRTLDQAVGRGWVDDVHPDDFARCRSQYFRAIRERAPFELEYRLRRVDGTWRWIRDRAVPLTDESGGFTGFVGAGVDLSEGREADDALRRSRDDRAAAMAVGRMGTFDLDLATGRISRDANLDALYGVAPGTLATVDEWSALIHPDDRENVLGEVTRATTSGGGYHLEHRIVRPDGQVRWMERRGSAYTDDAGSIAGVRGIVIDVTERKVAEQERAVLLERVTRLQAVTAAVARAGTPEEVLDVIVGQGMEAMGASAGSVAVLDARAAVLEVAGAGGYQVGLVEQFRRFDMGAPVPLAEAARTGAAVCCGDLEEWAARYPHLAAHPARSGHQAAAALPMLVDERVVGAVGLSFDRPQPFDTAQMQFLGAVVAQCAQALDRAWSYKAEAEARLAAEDARARLALLAEASIVLAGSLEYESTLPDVAAQAIPLLGDCCVIDIFDDEGELDSTGRRWRRVAAVHRDPQLEDRLRSVPPSVWAQADATSDTSTLQELGLRSALVVPLETRGGSLGVLALGRWAPGAFSDADRSIGLGLATRVAQAVDNALLYRAERRAHEEAETTAVRMRFLLDVSTTLAAQVDPDSRLDMLATQATADIADVCLIDVVQRDGSIRRAAASAADAELRPAADALRELMLSDPLSNHPSARTIRAGRTELCEDVTDERLRAMSISDAHFEISRRMGPLSYIAVPLPGIGRVLGAITLITTTWSGRRYGPADLALVEDMATRVALGLETASMHEEMRRVAQTLQASLLPSVPPAIPGLEVGTRYVAAGEGSVVGGDFFDVFAVGPDAWAVVVGDVCGQGVEAATVTGLARHTVRSAALAHTSPASVLAHLNDVLLQVGDAATNEADPRFCTVCLGRVRLTPAGAAVTLSLGGHPRPYVVRSDGTMAQVGRPGNLLGVVEPAFVTDEELELGAGDALVLYTDGITERHSGTSFFGDEGVERAITGTAGLSADDLAGRIEDAARRFVEGRPTDDMAVVVVRVPPR
jgi:PAS domain S-box-containing protein